MAFHRAGVFAGRTANGVDASLLANFEIDVTVSSRPANSRLLPVTRRWLACRSPKYINLDRCILEPVVDQPGDTGQLPLFLRLAADSTRWRLLTELARSDRRVSELTELLGERQNSVSYHLGRLRAGGLVSGHRSAADGRDSYYRIEFSRCAELLAQTGTALHPSLVPDAATRRVDPRPARRRGPVRVLFLCTGNSARSQIAEVLLQQAGGERVEVASAGSHPKALHPAALRVIRSYGIDPTDRRSKPLSEFIQRRFDYVITLCDRVREVCPDFPGHPDAIHWSIPDPAAATGGGRAIAAAFRATAADLQERVAFLTGRILSAAA